MRELRLRSALIAAALTFAALAAVFAIRLEVELAPQESRLWGHVLRDGFSMHRRYAWTGETAHMRVPGVGSGRWAIEVDLSGWRPRGRPAPRVVVRAEGASQTIVPSRQAETVRLEIDRGAWSAASVDVQILSDTFVPGGGDMRTLGARIYAVRARPLGGPLGVPPLWPPLALALVVGLIALASAPSLSRRAWMRLTGAAGLAATLGCVAARPWMVALTPGLLLAACALAVSCLVARRVVEALVESGALAFRAAWRTARALAWPGLPMLAVLAAGSVMVAHRARPVVAIDLGSRADRVVVHGFGPRDAEGGRHFRYATAQSQLRLDDVGGAGAWRVAVTAASGAGPRLADPLVRLESRSVSARLDGTWREASFEAHVPFRWRAGSTIALEHPPQHDVRVAEVRIDRRGTWPSPHTVVSVIAVGAFLALVLALLGAGRTAAVAAGALGVLGLAGLLAWRPLLGYASVDVMLVLCGIAAGLAAVSAGLLERLERESHDVAVWRAALPAALLGFVVWAFVLNFPLYRGGHFAFHSSIGEEIWHGRFLTYYLPYPGSMLSEQAQWGSVVMPHPCTYHALVAPLAALPRPAFYFAEKTFLGLGLASLALVAGVVAGRLASSPRAATLAATLTAMSAPTYQLLGLGHLMALLGCWASSWAMAYLTLHVDALDRPHVRWVFAGLLTFAFLAYFASVPFLSLALGLLWLVAAGRDRGLARWLAYSVALAGLLAFGLYYVHWSWPFFTESVPQLLGLRGSGAGVPPEDVRSVVWSRLLREPHKLSYTFGSWVVPLVGIAGLALARPWRRRAVVLAWAAILPIVCVLDVHFNFLLKHHYYAIAPVAIGSALVLDRLWRRGGWAIAAASVALLGAAVLGARTAIDAAMGFIP